ncbi:MAG: PQQ-dependent dehydrogenase, methanol/ethanol family [Acidobacteriota bacterium]
MHQRSWVGLGLLLTLTIAPAARAQVTADGLLNAGRDARNWITYSGTYASQRYSTLAQITPANAKNLELKWMYQGAVPGGWEATPLVVDGVMYVTQRPNDVVALDAKTGRVFWIYHPTLDPVQIVCCGANNRGLAILGDTLFLGTLDAHLIAIDTKTGRPVWNTKIAEGRTGYSVTMAPLVVKDKVLLGVGGSDFGVRGFVAAYDAHSGKEAWRSYMVPGPGEPGFETWQACPEKPTTYCDPEAWKHGGGAVWVTGSYDPTLNLTYWGTGNPGPDYNPFQRPGDNLYTTSVVALDADTGTLKWHYQFTPQDRYDYDAVQIPVLADLTWHGAPLKAMLWANRNGYFYLLDRATGKFLQAEPFIKLNWASGFDEGGRPIQTPQAEGQPTWPSSPGGTNWYSPSYSPRTGLFYLSVWENFAAIVKSSRSDYVEGRIFGGGGPTPFVPVPGAPTSPGFRRGPINTWTEAVGSGAIMALDATTGKLKWKFPLHDGNESGILTTASDVLFAGTNDGYFQAMDARSGTLLWKTILGGQVVNGPITYEIDGKQYVATISGLSLCVFGLHE